MAKKDGIINQVHEFMVVGPDESGLPNELAENPILTAPGADPEALPVNDRPPENDPFAGPRTWTVKWFGPFFNVAVLPTPSTMGLYMCYVGNYPLFFSSSANILAALSRHIIYSNHTIIPIDLLGREILHYAGLYKQPLRIKTGLLFEGSKLIHPREFLYCYRRAAAALAFCHGTPCNKYARLSYEFEPLSLTNLGRKYPLKDSFHVEPQERA